MNKYVYNTVTLAVFLSIAGCSDSENDITTSLTTENRTAQVIQLADPQTSSAKHFNGVVNSQHVAALAFRVPGTIDALLVSEGDVVEKGDLLATLDKHDYQVALEELEAKLLEAKSAHALANNELKRVKQARKDDAIATVNLDRAISAYERSLAMVKVVEKNIERAEDALRYTELRAPFSGLVGAIAFEEYEQLMPGISVLALQSPNQLQVEIDVPENLITQLTQGQEAVVSWYGATQKVNAVITEIFPFPHLIKQTYTVKLDLEGQPEDLFIGKALTVSIDTQANQDSFCLPYSAVYGANDSLYVNKVDHLVVRAAKVKTNVLKGDTVCIQGDIGTGDHVVITGTKYLKDGDKLADIVTRTE